MSDMRKKQQSIEYVNETESDVNTPLNNLNVHINLHEGGAKKHSLAHPQTKKRGDL